MRAGVGVPLQPPLFQSAPAIAGGRCADVPGLAGSKVVSIRARHCWRAMQADLRDHARGAGVSIRARHCWRAMPTISGKYPFAIRFQSAPAIAGGRCAMPRTRWCPACRFNPRPPLLAGDAPRCQGIANSSLFPYRARTPAAPSKGQTKIACEKEKPFGNNTLRSARTCLMQRHHFRFAALTIAWHPCPTAPAAHQNPRP